MCEQLPKQEQPADAFTTAEDRLRRYGPVPQAAREMTPQEKIDDVFQTLAIEFGDVLQRGPRGLDVRRLQSLHATVGATIERFVHAVERKSQTARSDGYQDGFNDGRREVLRDQQIGKAAYIDGERRRVGPDRAETRVAGQEQPNDPNRYSRPSDRLMARDLAKD
jgi:hypothetical protein